jgi:DNA-directed RNA polymerase sigma subunit (sigma70/sigma32)
MKEESYIEKAKKIAYKKGFRDGRKIRRNNSLEKLQRRKICKMLVEEGMTYEKVGFRFGITRERVRKILKNY